MSERETIHLAADLSFLHTDFLWRMPGSWVGYPYYSSSEFYEDIAKTAQQGRFDLLFFGDTGGTSEDFGGNHDAVVRNGVKWPRHDMTAMIPILARLTQGVGYALTMSTTYHHPFHCARTFNALDHVTKGRIAWNAVTSAYKWEAMNWGFEEMMDHDERYRRAQEFLQVACELWDSVEPDAVIMNRESGEFLDPEKVHRLDFKGDYFNVRGPLPALPSPQQRPVIIQAGSSGPGMDLAAKYADLQFSTRRTVESMKQHRAAIDEKLAKFGRTPRDLGILWSVRVQVAESVSEARAKEQAFLDSVPPEGGLIEMSQWFGVDFSTAELGMTLTDFADQVREQKGNLGTFDELLKTTDLNMTVREFGRDYMSQRVLVAEGTPKEIVDKLEMMHYETGANGGFILARGFHASDNIKEFVEHVVPELQRRGLSKKDYSGTTLRENFND
ncbi:MAG: NtaA/DmoA family FMN-dependent monooxygenase [Alphaproteobacteria bacterium]